MTANDAPPTPPAVTGQGEGGEVLGGSDGTLVCEMARAAQRQLDEWAGSHPDYVGVELPLSVGALRLLTRLPALVAQARAAAEAERDALGRDWHRRFTEVVAERAQARADGAAEERERIFEKLRGATVWADPMGQWTAVEAEAARGQKAAMLGAILRDSS